MIFLKCKYNKHILCDRVKLVCNGCTIEQAIMDERKRVKDILDKAEAEMFHTERHDAVADNIVVPNLKADTLVATEEVAKKLKTINK